MKTEHTKEKLCFHDNETVELHPVGDEEVGERTLAELCQDGYYNREIALANAKHFVKCWNMYYMLLGACKLAKTEIIDLERDGLVDNPEVFHVLRDVIALAEAK